MTHRPSGRLPHALRPVTLKTGVLKHAEGSCLVHFGETHVLCTASVEEKVPPFLRNSGLGWVTAEYGMLPRATHKRHEREAKHGKQSGRTQEIQRLIGRSLRAVVDREALGERQIRLDCDVLQADGGTRTAAITGAYVALHQACQLMMNQGRLQTFPLKTQVAAISCGLWQDTPILDLDYAEDSTAIVDSNFVFTAQGDCIEIQASGEERPFSVTAFQDLLTLAQTGTKELFVHQKKALEGLHKPS